MTMPFDLSVLAPVGWALVHLVWQGALVGAAAALALSLLRRRSANARYFVATGALLLMLVLPVATAIHESSQQTAIRSDRRVVARDLSVSIATPSPRAPQTWKERVEGWTFEASAAVQPHLPIVTFFWLAGVLVLSVRLAGGALVARRLLRHAAPAPESIERVVDRLTRALGILRQVRIVESDAVEVPTVVGWLSPVILLPVSAVTGLSLEQLETIIAHELAHIRRHDFAINFLQGVAETLLFYHPVVWWLSRQIRIEREHCCDDMAVALCGNAVAYARALAAMEEMRAVPQPAVAANGGSLLLRVRRLLGREERSPRSIVALLAFAFLIISFSTLPLAALAERSSEWLDEEVIAGSGTPAPAAARTTLDVVERRQASAGSGAAADPLSIDELLALRSAGVDEHRIESFEQAGIPVTIDDLVKFGNAGVDPEYIAEMQKATGRALDREELVNLRNMGVDAEDVAELAAAGVRAIDTDELVRLAAAGVDAAFVAEMKKYAPDHDIDTLVRLANAGVDPEYIASVTAAGLRVVDADELVRMANAGVDARYVKSMREAGLATDIDDLVRLANVGVDAETIAELRKQGVRISSANEMVKVGALGIDADFVAEMTALFGTLQLDELAQLAALGVDADYAREIQNAGLGKLDPKTLSSLKAVGVDSDLIADLRRHGVTGLSLEDLTGLAALGVDGEFIESLASEGLKSLDVDDLASLAALGVDGEYLAMLRRHGYATLDVEKLKRLAATGVDEEFLEEAKKLKRK